MGGVVSRPTVGDVVAALGEAFPPAHAEEWDRVGLLAGDANVPVTGVVLSLDPDRAALDLARSAGANLLVTHHPAYLKPPVPVRSAGAGGDLVFRAVAAGVALANAHTNLDRSPDAQRLLPRALGLTPVRPLERSLEPLSVVTVYAPASAADEIVDAMSRAGAGRLGEYTACAFEAAGVGRFTGSERTQPAVGEPGMASRVDEVRIEMTAPRARAARVAAAAVRVHPYEEPLVTVTDSARARGTVALGMVADTGGIRLGELVSRAAVAFGVTPRVWGDPEAAVATVACATGSAGSLVSDALASGARALIAGEVRYHDATDALDRGLAVVELGHDVSEWPLVRLLADVVRAVPGIDLASVVEMPPSAGWWTP